MTIQYWQHETTGEIYAVQSTREGDSEVLGVAGPLPYHECPRDARDYDGDFGNDYDTLDYFQSRWDEFRKTTIHPHADLTS